MVSSRGDSRSSVITFPCRTAITVLSVPDRATSTPMTCGRSWSGRPASSQARHRSLAASIQDSGMTASSSLEWNSPSTRFTYTALCVPHCLARCSAQSRLTRPAATASSSVTCRGHQSVRPGARAWILVEPPGRLAGGGHGQREGLQPPVRARTGEGALGRVEGLRDDGLGLVKDVEHRIGVRALDHLRLVRCRCEGLA